MTMKLLTLDEAVDQFKAQLKALCGKSAEELELDPAVVTQYAEKARSRIQVRHAVLTLASELNLDIVEVAQ